MKISKGNLLDNATASDVEHVREVQPAPDAEHAQHIEDVRVVPREQRERHDDLYMSPRVRVTRIESSAYTSPEGFWYDQPEDEWVVVIAGAAVIEFDDGMRHPMGVGDWLVIPAHCRHRVAETGEKTIWLAVHGS